MAANTDPIYSRAPDIQTSDQYNSGTGIGGSGLGNTARDGSSGATNMWQVFQADLTNGGFIQRLRVKLTHTSGASTATVLRVFICSNTSGSFTAGTTNTSTNTTLYTEMSIPSLTATDTAGLTDFELPLNFALPAGYRILVSVGTAMSTGLLSVTAIGGKY